MSVAGYAGQQDLAEDAIDVIVERDDVATWSDAWILTARAATQASVEPTVLAGLGRSFPGDYEQVGVYALDQAAQTLVLWRPRDT